MKATTIKADVQNTILTILPDRYDEALDLMAQLSANMILSSPERPDLKSFLANVKAHYDAYLELEKQ
jgi:hypothetical protein